MMKIGSLINEPSTIINDHKQALNPLSSGKDKGVRDMRLSENVVPQNPIVCRPDTAFAFKSQIVGTPVDDGVGGLIIPMGQVTPAPSMGR
jgi:hypothetical protein